MCKMNPKQAFFCENLKQQQHSSASLCIFFLLQNLVRSFFLKSLMSIPFKMGFCKIAHRSSLILLNSSFAPKNQGSLKSNER